MKNIFLKFLIKVVNKIIYKIILIIIPNIYNNTVKNLKWFNKNKGYKKKFDPLKT